MDDSTMVSARLGTVLVWPSGLMAIFHLIFAEGQFLSLTWNCSFLHVAEYIKIMKSFRNVDRVAALIIQSGLIPMAVVNSWIIFCILHRSPSPSSTFAARRRREAAEAHNRAMGERRVVYVGGITDRYTRSDLRKRFAGFGEIESVLTVLREEGGENYGFVTFFSKADAYAAVESKLVCNIVWFCWYYICLP